MRERPFGGGGPSQMDDGSKQLYSLIHSLPEPNISVAD